ncbi:hypothetical protein CPT_Moonbeam147 [Bacillus phage Moonbeam]|uniref:Uncharacterized protein n=1 Tax=Bacillus phage Moonbeam TaxID=1540091 RepID=A0A0A0RN86_9CAUD|nr:hypothetical protein CPT_Moonbeam147 [Bacillus phage Moonbeam]AIW03545.1 hypothetical protein CPT_Moonbeam147 [Bacillus phage Moonbeam]
MKLTTYYIEEVHNEGPYSMDWSAQFPGKLFVKVSLTVKAGGLTQKLHRIWETERWKEVKERGLFTE